MSIGLRINAFVMGLLSVACGVYMLYMLFTDKALPTWALVPCFFTGAVLAFFGGLFIWIGCMRDDEKAKTP